MGHPVATFGLAAALQLLALAGCAAGTAPASPWPPAALGGTSWDLVEMGPTADFAHLLPTIEFTGDGRVAGFAACNTFHGTYTTDGSALRLGPLATTKIGCPRPASAVESAYLEALGGVSTWSIEADGRLLLDGAISLRFARADGLKR